jgi:hypothetical protein
MKYTLDSGRVIEIGDNAIKNLMDACGCSKEEAIDIWLTDHGFIVNQEQEELDKSAKSTGFRAESGKKTSKKPRTVKISAEKVLLFNEIKALLLKSTYFNGTLTENRQLSAKIGEKTFKITITEDRK